ncbi:BON domain-containing protein [Marinobacter zhanjiangensis]|uniref:BON domain-containing protein n=1 Tax=Marinobacter zhanjiangensis TaxID=578215 RepID=A0ABQ3AT28_9GAMM|nr:BON domain-containing protein [Marinobacter zhanjiangensis]GGY65783.1 hypothetical protein GCM10007071_10690 [Marinobacter zhanjiangensis]
MKPAMVRSDWLNVVLVSGMIVFSGCAGFAGENTQQDAAEAVRLKAVLLEAPDLAGSAIDVTVSEDRILLEGFVEKATQRQRTEDLVREHSEIDQVSNRIEVK